MVLDAPVSATPEPAVAEGPDDAALVAAVRRGDDRAFEQLYARYQRRISAYVLGMVKDHGRAEDITQEVFISALRRMRETEPRDRVQAVDLRDRQERLHRPVPPLPARRGGLLRRRRGPRPGRPRPPRRRRADARTTRSTPSSSSTTCCGAFGGLSDSHHEILVLREFEGLSYREIGDRMGLSRPGVESTLFRARKRLTEEYDELVSGQRCLRIQSIIAAAGGTALGTRDARRLARHVSHCQPCRRKALAAGLDIASLPRTPVRRAIERAAGFLPLPAFLRARFFASEQMVPVSEPMAAAWSKAVAAGAALLVAGVGAGVAPHGGGKPPALKPDSAKPAAAHTRSASPSGGTRVRRPLAVAPRKQAVVKSTSHTGGKRSASLGKSQRGSAPSSAGSAERSGDAGRRLDQAGRDEPDRLHAEPDARRPRADRRRDRDDDAEPAEGHAAQDRDARRLHPGRRRGRADRQRRDRRRQPGDGERAGHGRRRDGRAPHAVVSPPWLTLARTRSSSP